jgi:hypothetical protein
MKLFLSIAAILAGLFGFMLLAIPEKFYEPAGIVMTPMIATVAQAHGATLVGLGAINWMARSADRRGLLAVLTGNLVVQLLVIVRRFPHDVPRRGHGGGAGRGYPLHPWRLFWLVPLESERGPAGLSAYNWQTFAEQLRGKTSSVVRPSG